MCSECQRDTLVVSAILDGRYYAAICRSCVSERSTVYVSSGAAGYDRRRGYEDMAQDTVQPYNASGPNVEFLRLYPDKAAKIFTPSELEVLKRKI